jgi:uncharacterized lipoprotein YddW (UPF0748 family)
MISHRTTLIAWLAFVSSVALAAPPPPLPARELRGSWVATVRCVNWPREPGLPVEKQKAQLLEIIEHAAGLRLNCLIFQVRPAGDAMYRSEIEPWSPWLTGEIGKAPSPMWDPLEFAVAESHKRGIELHAWFNPYRALATTERFTPKGTHIVAQHPEWTMRYGIDTWMNPGEPGVRDRAKAVMLDVARRYDVDGIHMDDYFYPYPVKGANGELVPFPDEKTYQRYRDGGGTLELAAWRRQNVDELVRQTYTELKALKRWVKFGISPFGLWRPGFPPGTGGGLDPYEDLGADSLKWLQSGWLDYLAPQLYWPIEPAQLSFTTFYDWWQKENVMQRHIWPGMALDRIGKDRGPGEILRQLSVVRSKTTAQAPGHLHWSFGILKEDRSKIATITRQRAYQLLAIPPVSPWLGALSLPAPVVQRQTAATGNALRWNMADTRWLGQVRWWVIQVFSKGQWSTEKVLPVETLTAPWPKSADAVALRAAGYAWELGPAGVLSR